MYSGEEGRTRKEGIVRERDEKKSIEKREGEEEEEEGGKVKKGNGLV